MSVYSRKCFSYQLMMMTQSVYTEYIQAKGYTVRECYKPAEITDETVYAAGYASREEYEQALHEFLNEQ